MECEQGLNVYQFIGELFHIFALFILFVKIILQDEHSLSVFGISGKSLILSGFLDTFWIIARYFNIFGSHTSGSVYYSVLNVLYLLSITLLIVLTYRTFKDTYQKEYDTFSIPLLIFSAAILAVFINYVGLGKGDNFWLCHNLMKVVLAFSIYLEAVTMVPQLFMIWKFGYIDAFMILYLISMATYKGMYIGDWAYKYISLQTDMIMIVVVGCAIETAVIVWILALLTLVVIFKVIDTRQEQKKMENNVTPNVEAGTFKMDLGSNLPNKNENQTKMDQVRPQLIGGTYYDMSESSEIELLSVDSDSSNGK